MNTSPYPWTDPFAQPKMPAYDLNNWDEIDQWGRRYNVTWSRACDYARHRQLDEVAKLKLLAVALLEESEQLRAALLDMLLLSANPHTISIRSETTEAL